MDEKERKGIVDSLFPVNGERWFKVKIVDQEKAIKTLWMPMDEVKAQPYVEKCGFSVVAIGCRDEYVPQIQAIMDLEVDIIGQLYGHAPNYIVENINALFNSKMDELKQYTIKTEIPQI